MKVCIIYQLALKMQESLVELMVKNLPFMKFQSSLEASMVTKWQYMKFQNIIQWRPQKGNRQFMKFQNSKVA